MGNLRWAFYTWQMNCKDGHCTNVFERTGKIYKSWPTVYFEKLAKRMGYNRLVRDTTIIGGYFVNSAGDCLVCIPADKDPHQWYEES